MRRALLLTLWLITDHLVFVGAYALAYFLRVGFIFSSDFPFDRFILIAALVSPVWLAMLIGTRTFALLRKQLSARTFAYIVFAGVGGLALFSLAYYFVFENFFSRMLLLYALAFSIVGAFGWHLFFGWMSRLLMRKHPASYPTLIVGVTRESTQLIRTLEKNQSPLKPVAILDGKGVKEKEISGVPVVGKLNKLEDVLHDFGITHLIQCSDLEQSLNLLSACRQRRIIYMLLPSVLGIVEPDERIEMLEGRAISSVKPQQDAWQWFFQ